MLWSGVVTPKSPLSMEAPFDLRITMATLGNVNSKNERTTLIMTHEDFIAEEARSISICSLISGRHENQSIDLVLDEGEPVSFKVNGDGDIHLSGYFVIDENDNENSRDALIDSLGIFEDESDDESFEVPKETESSEEETESSSEEEPKIQEVPENIEESILDKVRKKQASLKRKNPPKSSTSPPKKKQKNRK